jgi:hypothetical protein
MRAHELGAVLDGRESRPRRRHPSLVARLDGARMPDADHAFYAFSDALRLPGQFGWSWNALSDSAEDQHTLVRKRTSVVAASENRETGS